MTYLALTPAIIQGRHVRLEQLALRHQTELCDVGLDPDLWTWTMTRAHTPDQLMDYIRDAVGARADGHAIPFALRDAVTGKAIGSTRFGSIDEANRRVEIGWTWLAADRQRSPINTEAKLLLLTHAFETLDCIRVEFKTDVLNLKSRNALTRIGAIEEGVLRSHVITWTGRVRDTVYFSILAGEWPAVKKRLQDRLATG